MYPSRPSHPRRASASCLHSAPQLVSVSQDAHRSQALSPAPSGLSCGRPSGNSESSSQLSDAPSFSTLSVSPPATLVSELHLPERPAVVNAMSNNYALQGIWDIYRNEAGDFDAAMIQSWNACIDNLILFAGVFSGITTTFIVESYKSLRLPPPARLHPAEGCGMFECGPHATRINTMWFTSLALSIVSALVAMIAKQWIAGYKVELLFSGTGTSEWFHESCRLRQFRYDGLKKYKMGQVISMTPVLLHISVWCFCAGLMDFLWTVNHTVAIPLTCLCGLTFMFYVGSTISAVVSPQSPFKTALARLICSIRKGDQEYNVVQMHGPKLDQEVVEWLISTSRNQAICNKAMQALEELRRAESKTV